MHRFLATYILHLRHKEGKGELFIKDKTKVQKNYSVYFMRDGK